VRSDRFMLVAGEDSGSMHLLAPILRLGIRYYPATRVSLPRCGARVSPHAHAGRTSARAWSSRPPSQISAQRTMTRCGIILTTF